MSAITHTHGVGSLSLHAERPIDLLRSQAWLCGIIDDPNTDVVRIKGLVRCPQYVEAVIVPGIHHWFDVRLGDDASCKNRCWWSSIVA